MKTRRSDRQLAADDSPSPKRPNPGQEPPIAAGEVFGEGQLPPGALDDETSSSFSRGLHLLRLLLQCAECVSVDDLDGAADLLPEIAELSSPFGTPPERVAAHFARALQARVISTLLPMPPPRCIETLASRDAENQARRTFSALQCYNSISPLIKFSHFTANQAILEALDGEDRVHLIDLDIMQGLQWPGLFHILAASRSRSLLRSLRITGFGSSLRSLEATGRRLAEFASALGLPFEFTPLEAKPGTLTDPRRLGATDGEGEATVVHWAQHSLYDVSADDLETLRLMALVKPKLITIVERDLDLSRPSSGAEFLSRFVEALHYYSALFDALGEGLGAEMAEERHAVEVGVFGREIRNVIGRRPAARVGRWGEALRKAGFRGVSLGGSAAAQAGLLLGMLPWTGGYTLTEENGCLKLGWKDLSLLTASAWEPND